VLNPAGGLRYLRAMIDRLRPAAAAQDNGDPEPLASTDTGWSVGDPVSVATQSRRSPETSAV